MLFEKSSFCCSIDASSAVQRLALAIADAALALWSAAAPEPARLEASSSALEPARKDAAEPARGSAAGISQPFAADSRVLANPAAAAAEGEMPEDPPSFWEDGVALRGPLWNPGKLDALYRSRPNADEYNLFWWSPLVKAGAGAVDLEGAGSTEYAGGYARPLLPLEGAGELVVGALAVDAGGNGSYEAQAEYRLPSGFGLGGGLVDRPQDAGDVRFAKATYRDRIDALSFIVEAQAQETGSHTEPGGYLALYGDELMGVVGHDGEQWRATLNYIAPESDARLRPALEGLYVDSSVGEIDGTQTLFVNGTLQYGGGFLSHPSALGRAMGPQGLEFGNPLGFLSPTWNRRLDTWELGRLANWRVVRTEAPDGTAVTDCELVLYALQLDRDEHWLDSVLVGASYIDSPDLHSPGLMVGFSGPTGFLNTSLVARTELDTGDFTLTLGLIDRF